MRIAIIEDEWLVAEDLSSSLKQVRSDIEIDRIVTSVKEAAEYFRDEPSLDLVFSDIQLGDGLAFEISSQVEIKVPIVFCTAFDEYAIEAFKTNGIDYVLKPFTIESLTRAIKKYEKLKNEFNQETQRQYEIIKETLSTYRLKTSSTFMVKYRDRFLPINLDKVAYYYLANDVCHLYTHSGTTYIIPEALDELEKKCGENFFRVNRQFLVNRNAIKDVAEYFPRKLKVNLTVAIDRDILISKERRSKFLEWLNL